MSLTAVPITGDLVRGTSHLEPTERGLELHRLPAWARLEAASDQLSMAESQPAGVRLVFATRATTIELDTVPTKRDYVGAPARPDGVYDLLVDGSLVAQGSVPGGDTLVIDMGAGTFEHRPGDPGTLRFSGLPERDKRVEIWLPHDETTVLSALRTDAPVRPAARTERVWLHHGSSISHGSNATHPTGTWPAIAARLGGVDLVNLGLGGSALLDPFTARAMGETPADLVSVKIGINLVNQGLMRLEQFRAALHGFLDTLRAGHPDVPLLVVSPVLCPMHEDTPGPSLPDSAAMAQGRVGFLAAGDPGQVAFGALTLRVIRDELARITAERAASDPHLHHLDGRLVYGEADAAALPLPDGLHPDGATHRVMAERFAAAAFGGGGAFRTR